MIRDGFADAKATIQEASSYISNGEALYRIEAAA
jgi:hypothetical protein